MRTTSSVLLSCVLVLGCGGDEGGAGAAPAAAPNEQAASNSEAAQRWLEQLIGTGTELADAPSEAVGSYTEGAAAPGVSAPGQNAPGNGGGAGNCARLCNEAVAQCGGSSGECTASCAEFQGSPCFDEFEVWFECLIADGCGSAFDVIDEELDVESLSSGPCGGAFTGLLGCAEQNGGLN